jgi:prepilin-type processing-associated H-X9-DG protein
VGSSRSRRRGIKIGEVLILVGIVALLISIILPSITRLRQTAGRTKCGSNLRQIGQAILLYSNENKGAYPRTVYTPGAMPTWGTGAGAANPFSSPDRPADNDVTAAMFLLIRTQDITSSVFVCDGNEALVADDFGGRGGSEKTRSNFTDWRRNLSYSLHNPYPASDEAALDANGKMPALNDKDFAIAADMNGGVGEGSDVTAVTERSASGEMARANSPVHGRVGQNVLYGDGHVEFQQNPFCGVKGDNIYTVAAVADGEPRTTGKTVVGVPSWAGDSVLLPALR